MKTRIGLCAMVAVALVALGRPASAQWVEEEPDETPYARRHFYLGARMTGATVVGQSGPRAFLTGGGGFALYAGGRLSRTFALEGAWEPTWHNQSDDIYGRPYSAMSLSAFTLDAKFHPIDRRIQPWIGLGLGYYVLSDPGGPLADGFGFQLGVGLDLWATSWLSLGGRAQYRGVSLADIDRYYEDTTVGLVYLGADLTFHF